MSETLAERSEVEHNGLMDNNITFTVSQDKLYSVALQHVVPFEIIVTFVDVAYIEVYRFDEQLGEYLDSEGNALTVTFDGEQVVDIDVPEAC